ncbi:hypothetical protein [Devosia sp. FKR38]|uniref:hypothetical protein n=1 Tax=Devosia sp. FKR38 TaxID=2562312 RepID=UPI0010C0F9CD|nr:hypothetical protein [Devosia sp. FKR38]
MTATNQTKFGTDPASGMSVRDALLLAVRNWIWLIGVPLATLFIVSAIYTNLPTRTTVTAVLNADMDLVELYAKPIIDGLDPTATLTLTKGNGTVIITSDAPDTATAQALVQQVLDATPQPELPQTSLTPTQSLELRALREYRTNLQTLLSSGTAHAAETNALEAEMAQAQGRIDYLELRDVAPEALPKVAQEARATPIRQPPLRNVAIFTLVFTLFVTWALIYGLERRRVVREKGML